jgi:hypothetical protein
MNPADAEEYTQALGQVVAGGWRQVALGQRLGVPDALGLTTTEWVERRLGGYIRMSIPDRREAVRELTAPVETGGQGLSTREAAAVLGVNHDTVAVDKRAVGNPTPEWGRGTDADDPVVGNPTPDPEVEGLIDVIGDEVDEGEPPELTVRLSSQSFTDPAPLLGNGIEEQRAVLNRLIHVKHEMESLSAVDPSPALEGWSPEGHVMAVRSAISQIVAAAHAMAERHNAALDQVTRLRVVER